MIEGKKIKILQQIKLLLEIRELLEEGVIRNNDEGEIVWIDSDMALENWIFQEQEDLIYELVGSEEKIEDEEDKGQSYTPEQIDEFFQFLGVKKYY